MKLGSTHAATRRCRWIWSGDRTPEPEALGAPSERTATSATPQPEAIGGPDERTATSATPEP